MAEANGSPPPGGDETRAPTIIGVYSTMTAVSLTCVAARLYTRLRLLRSPGWDDAVIVISMVSTITLLTFSGNVLIRLGHCLCQPCSGMLWYKIWFGQAHVLFDQGRGLASIQMELCCRSMGHHGSRYTETGYRAIPTENCGQSQTPKNVIPLHHYLCEHHIFRHRCGDFVSTMQSALLIMGPKCPSYLLEPKRPVRSKLLYWG